MYVALGYVIGFLISYICFIFLWRKNDEIAKDDDGHPIIVFSLIWPITLIMLILFFTYFSVLRGTIWLVNKGKEKKDANDS